MRYRYFLTLVISLFATWENSFSQLVSDNVFLQGKWLEGVMAPNGSWGNSVAIPAGYHKNTGPAEPGSSAYTDPILGTTPSGGLMDFNYDFLHSGWAPGSFTSTVPPWYGPYFMPGTPFDGWAMQVNGVRSDAWYTNYGFWNATGGTLTGTCTGYAYTPAVPGAFIPSTMKGTWTGTAGTSSALQISQELRIDTFAQWAVVTTKFKNTSGSTMPGLYYFVSGDPDNDETDSAGSFTTDNHICYQGDAYNRHEVNAVPNPGPHPKCFSGLATKDCRAKALIYTAWAAHPSEGTGQTLDQIWTESPSWLGTYYYTLNTTTVSQDIAYGLIYNLGDLPAGDSTFLSFAWIFTDSTAIDSAFPAPRIATMGSAFDSLDTVRQCTMTGYGVSGTTFTVDLPGGYDKEWTYSNWTWAPATGLSATTGTHVVVDFALISGITTYTITGWQDTAAGMCGAPKTFLLTVIPCFSASNNGPICVTDTLWLYGNDADSVGATYRWYGPVGFSAFTKTAYRTGMTMADTGWYFVVRTYGTSSDTTKTHVMLKPLPVVVATSNSPICSGPPNVLTLNVAPDSVGETFAWTGPNSFTSGAISPSISGPPVSYSGLYKVVATFNGCKDSGYVNVTIDTTPAKPILGSNAPICSGHWDTLKLTSTDATPGVGYTWSGPSGFSSFLQNPVIPDPSTFLSGTFTLTVSITADGITCSNKNTINVVVDSTPYLPIMGSNAPICSGQTLLLTALSTTGSTYSWIGPDGFTSTLQNPSIAPAITAATGVYSVSATIGYPGIVGGCISDTATLMVVVDSTPVVPIASSNSPGPPSICERDTLFLTSSDGTAGVTYNWTGPAGFTSTLENPIISHVAAAATGNYTVTVTLAGACSASTIITVSITPTPTLIATSNSPVCTGVNDTLFLEATSNPGATFSWTGPYVLLSNLQNPVRTPVIMDMSGVYQVTASLNGCTSLPVNDTVLVRQTPPVPWVKDTAYCQYYKAPPLQAYGDSILWYATRNVLGPASLNAPTFSTNTDTTLWFYVTQTVMNCTSAMDSFSVTVNPNPLVTTSPSVGICPHDSVLLVATDADQQISYHWSPSIYLDLRDTANASVLAKPITDITYRVVTTNQFNCHDTAFTSVKVNAGAVLYLGDSVILYPGQTYQLSPQTNCASFTWSPAAGLDNPYVSNPIASPQISTKYIVRGITNWGCVAIDSIDIYVNPETLLSLPNAFAPGSGANNEFKILKEGIATLNYFRIFDRWGVMVFETTDINEGWDGTYKGKPQPLGVYVYEVSATTSAGRAFTKHGNVTLLR